MQWFLFIVLVPFSPWLLSGCGSAFTSSLEPYLAWIRPANKPEPNKDPIGDLTPAQLQSAGIDTPPEENASASPVSVEAKNNEAEAAASDETKGAPEQTEAREPPPTTLQEVPGPKADDRLLGLWQNEVEQAMQQPPGSRKIQFSMPLEENDRVRYFVELFCGKMRDFFERALARSAKYAPMMATVLKEAGLPEDLVYLSLIESGFAPAANSKARAVGPWQFMRATGIRYGLRIDSWVDERRDPVKSTRAAAAYLKDLHEQFGEWFLAAAAYNAGERRVEDAIQHMRTNDFWLLSERTNLKQETRNYVPKFVAAALIASTPGKYGFSDFAYESPVEYDEVITYRPLSLQTVAKLARTNVENIRELNPSLLRNTTPPAEKGFSLRVPAGSGDGFNEAYKSQFDSTSVKVITYTVKKGETLAAIAKRYHQRTSQIMEANELKTSQLRIGQQLMIVLDGSASEARGQQSAGKPPLSRKMQERGRARASSCPCP